MLELSLHILDIVENSTRAGAKTVQITIKEETDKDLLALEINDDGSGMDEMTVKRLTDPFFTTKTVRKIGLGLPLLAQAAETAGGKLTVKSAPGKGTTVTAHFKLSHIDRQPLGDMASTMVAMIAGNPGTDFIYQHWHDESEYRLDTHEIREGLEDLEITNPEVLNFLKENINSGIADIGAMA